MEKRRRILVIALLVGFLCAVRAPAQKIETQYNRFEDRTTVSVNFSIFVAAKDHSVLLETMVLAFTYSGQTRQKPDVVLVAFTTHSHDWAYRDPTQLIAILDGERLILGQTERFKADATATGTDEAVALKISRENFLRVAKAKSVELYLAPVAFQPKEKMLAKLREFAALVE